MHQRIPLVFATLVAGGFLACADDGTGAAPVDSAQDDGGAGPARPAPSTPATGSSSSSGAPPPVTSGDAGSQTDASDPPDAAAFRPLGICAPNSPTNLDAVMDDLQALHVTSVRIWLSVNHWDGTEPFWADSVNAAKKYKARGFHVVVAMVPEDGIKPANPAQVVAVVDHAIDHWDLGSVVDIWEIGNEPDHDTYWNGAQPADYAKKYLIPAAKRFHERGAKVTNAAPSWNPEDVKTILDTVDTLPDGTTHTAWEYLDYVNLHLYQQHLSGADQTQTTIARLDRLVELAKGKPTMSTEWSADDPKTGDADWAQSIATMWPLVRQRVDFPYYYIWMRADSSHGHDGLVDTNRQHRAHFWSTFESF